MVSVRNVLWVCGVTSLTVFAVVCGIRAGDMFLLRADIPNNYRSS
jgi:hypothetical protein